MTPSEQQRVVAVKAALIHMTGTSGWGYFKQIANNIVQKAVQDALDEEDSEKGEAKRLKASALQKGLAELFRGVELTKAFDPDTVQSDSGFEQLEVEAPEVE